MIKDSFNIRMVFFLIAIVLVSILTTGCTATNYKGFRNGTNPADFAVINAKIFTSDEANPWSEAVAIKNERIVYVGGDQGVADFIGPNTRVVDADGRMVTPGFIDNHCHVLWMGAMMSMMADLFEARDFNEFKAGVIKYGKDNQNSPFVMAIGWKPEYLPNPSPTTQMADAIISERPLFLWGAIGHIGWVNTKAAEIMQARNPQAFKELTPELDQKGRPTGIFHHFYAFNPFDYFTLDEFGPEMKKRMFARMSGTIREALKVGVTTMNDVQIYKTFIPPLLEFQRSGGLRQARVRGTYYISHYAHNDFEGLKKDLALWKALGPKHTDSHLVLSDSVKIYIDGVSANRTTFMLDPFSDHPPGEVGYAL
ncbi:MAG: hypothetical protein C0407_08425, partial [Desulfobacca sp.]|nr:hypothetical protein [Desulfobacca sp.]